jgi:hypothetical protein
VSLDDVELLLVADAECAVAAEAGLAEMNGDDAARGIPRSVNERRGAVSIDVERMVSFVSKMEKKGSGSSPDILATRQYIDIPRRYYQQSRPHKLNSRA